MFFDGDYFDIILFCTMSALLIAVVVRRMDLLKEFWKKGVAYCGRWLGILCSKIKKVKITNIILNTLMLVIASFFLCRDDFADETIVGSIIIFISVFLKVFCIYMVMLFVSYTYFTFIRFYFAVGEFTRKALTVTTLLMAVILERHQSISTFTVAVLMLIVALYYIINMTALFKTVGIAKRKTTAVRTIWLNVTAIIGMFILLFSILYYEIGEAFPDAFNQSLSFLDAMYFTLVTFATIGFGDIAATGTVTKVITIVNAFTSIACLIFLVNAIMGLTAESGED